jgi:hypothetical protein
MKKLALILTITLLFLSCKTDKDYSGITGVWVVEEQGEITPFRRYNVSIRRYEFIDSVYIISNLNRSGDFTEVYFELAGLTISMQAQLIGNYTFNGTGTVQPDFKGLTLNYMVYNSQIAISENVVANFRRE